jgi:hypothetical protein
MLQCSQCRRLSNDDETTCRWCGHGLADGIPAKPADAQRTEYGLPRPLPDDLAPPPRPAYGLPRPIPGPGGLGLFIVIGVLAAIAAAMWLLLRR